MENTTILSPLSSTANDTIQSIYWFEYITNPTVKALRYYFYTPCIILGLIGNGFCFFNIACRRLYRKSPVFLFYTFLAMTDFIELVSEMAEMAEDISHVAFYSRYDLRCQTIVLMNQGSSVASSWLLVAVTAFRLYGIALPLHMIKSDRLKASVYICAFCLIVPYGFMLHPYWTVGIVSLQVEPYVYLTYCFIKIPKMTAYYGIVTATFYSVGVGVLLVLLSCGIIVSFVVSYRRHKSLLSGESTDTNQVSNTYVAAKNSVFMLVPLAILHVSSTFPVVFYWFYVGRFNVSPTVYYGMNRMRCINHSFNFYIQTVVSRYYRETMLPCFVKKKE